MIRLSQLRLAVVASVALCAGCNGPTTTGPVAPATPLMIDGSSTVFPISMAAQEGYSAIKPAFRIVVANHGTGGGFGRYIEGEVDIVDASRAAKAEEEEDAKAKGFDWTRFLIAHDGITVVLHPSNTFVESLSVEQLKKLFAIDNPATKWSDLDPAWPDRSINLYTPDDDSGTYEFFAEAIVGGKAHRKDVQASSDDNTLVNGVSSDADGLGYFGYAYYAENKDKLRAVPIRTTAEAEAVPPSPETIHSDQYKPLSRPLYIYVKNSSLRRPEVYDFVKYYLDNSTAFAEKTGYVAPTESELAANRQALAGADTNSEASGSPASE
jgi:phosphate transport system substrate-binding protein